MRGLVAFIPVGYAVALASLVVAEAFSLCAPVVLGICRDTRRLAQMKYLKCLRLANKRGYDQALPKRSMGGGLMSRADYMAFHGVEEFFCVRCALGRRVGAVECRACCSVCERWPCHVLCVRPLCENQQ